MKSSASLLNCSGELSRAKLHFLLLIEEGSSKVIRQHLFCLLHKKKRIARRTSNSLFDLQLFPMTFNMLLCAFNWGRNKSEFGFCSSPKVREVTFFFYKNSPKFSFIARARLSKEPLRVSTLFCVCVSRRFKKMFRDHPSISRRRNHASWQFCVVL